MHNFWYKKILQLIFIPDNFMDMKTELQVRGILHRTDCYTRLTASFPGRPGHTLAPER